MTARFAVRVSAPVYDASTDGYVGHRVYTNNIFSSLAEAVDYAWLEGAEAYACGDTDHEFFVAYRTTGASSGRKVWAPILLEPYAADTSPLPYPWTIEDDSIPF